MSFNFHDYAIVFFRVLRVNFELLRIFSRKDEEEKKALNISVQEVLNFMR